MSYTLAKWALWLIAAAAIGLVVGWMLRGARRSSAPKPTEDELTELARLRGREKEMDRVVRDVERLRIDLNDCRAAALRTPSVPLAAVAADIAPATAPVDARNSERLASLVVEQDAIIGELRARIWNREAKISELQGALTTYNLSTAPRDPDLQHGAEVLGETVRLNDLTMVEGIGPKIADMLQTTGVIKTWWELHLTDVATLRTLLDGAGPRFQIHDPSSWPRQAGMLARGEWEDFNDFTAELRDGRFDG